MVIEDLERKVEIAPVTASDEFMYQDREESQKELEVAKRILDESPEVLLDENLEPRTWNVLPYKRYRGSDEPNNDK